MCDTAGDPTGEGGARVKARGGPVCMSSDCFCFKALRHRGPAKYGATSVRRKKKVGFGPTWQSLAGSGAKAGDREKEG